MKTASTSNDFVALVRVGLTVTIGARNESGHANAASTCSHRARPIKNEERRRNEQCHFTDTARRKRRPDDSHTHSKRTLVMCVCWDSAKSKETAGTALRSSKCASTAPDIRLFKEGNRSRLFPIGARVTRHPRPLSSPPSPSSAFRAQLASKVNASDEKEREAFLYK